MMAPIQFQNGTIFAARHDQLGLTPYEASLYLALKLDPIQEVSLDARARHMAQRLASRPMEGHA